MSYIPIVPYVPPPQGASPQALELGVQMAQLVQEFQKQNPSLSSTEVQQAMQIAKQATGMTRSAATGVMVAVGVGLMGVLLAGVLFFRQAGGDIELPVTAFPMIAVVALVVLVLGVVAVIRNQ